MCVGITGRRAKVGRDEEWGLGVSTWRKESDVGVDRGEAIVLKGAFYETHWVCHSDFSSCLSLRTRTCLFFIRMTYDNNCPVYSIITVFLITRRKLCYTIYIRKLIRLLLESWIIVTYTISTVLYLEKTFVTVRKNSREDCNKYNKISWKLKPHKSRFSLLS